MYRYRSRYWACVLVLIKLALALTEIAHINAQNISVCFSLQDTQKLAWAIDTFTWPLTSAQIYLASHFCMTILTRIISASMSLLSSGDRVIIQMTKNRFSCNVMLFCLKFCIINKVIGGQDGLFFVQNQYWNTPHTIIVLFPINKQ